MRLAIFDLDNTLLAGDSDHQWGEYLCARGLVDVEAYRAKNDAFYADYLAGQLDVVAYTLVFIDDYRFNGQYYK